MTAEPRLNIGDFRRILDTYEYAKNPGRREALLWSDIAQCADGLRDTVLVSSEMAQMLIQLRDDRNSLVREVRRVESWKL